MKQKHRGASHQHLDSYSVEFMWRQGLQTDDLFVEILNISQNLPPHMHNEFYINVHTKYFIFKSISCNTLLILLLIRLLFIQKVPTITKKYHHKLKISLDWLLKTFM